MRPIRRGDAPQIDDFVPYNKARNHLITRLGPYCSYCERPIYGGLAVEHIQAKTIEEYAHLQGTWTNFLLSCVNCNSTKSKKNVIFSDYLIPDRDNTFAAFDYFEDGTVTPRAGLSAEQLQLAERTLDLVGLSKDAYEVFDDNGKQVVVDRVSKRKETWLTALDARKEFDEDPDNVSENYKRTVTTLMLRDGGFSIWMKVFEGIPSMQRMFIESFPSTVDSGCFVAGGVGNISPHPNEDFLEQGSKI